MTITYTCKPLLSVCEFCQKKGAYKFLSKISSRESSNTPIAHSSPNPSLALFKLDFV